MKVTVYVVTRYCCEAEYLAVAGTREEANAIIEREITRRKGSYPSEKQERDRYEIEEETVDIPQP